MQFHRKRVKEVSRSQIFAEPLRLYRAKPMEDHHGDCSLFSLIFNHRTIRYFSAKRVFLDVRVMRQLTSCCLHFSLHDEIIYTIRTSLISLSFLTRLLHLIGNSLNPLIYTYAPYTRSVFVFCSLSGDELPHTNF